MLPCFHDDLGYAMPAPAQMWISEDKRLSLSDFHSHWHNLERILLRPDAIERPEHHLPVVLEHVANNVATLPDPKQRATI